MAAVENNILGGLRITYVSIQSSHDFIRFPEESEYIVAQRYADGSYQIASHSSTRSSFSLLHLIAAGKLISNYQATLKFLVNKWNTRVSKFETTAYPEREEARGRNWEKECWLIVFTFLESFDTTYDTSRRNKDPSEKLKPPQLPWDFALTINGPAPIVPAPLYLHLSFSRLTGLP